MWTKWASQVLIMATCLCGTGLFYNKSKPLHKQQLTSPLAKLFKLQTNSVIGQFKSSLFIKGTNLIYPLYIHDGKPVARLIPPPETGKVIPIEIPSISNLVVTYTPHQNK